MDTRSLPSCTCFNLRKAAMAVTRAYNEALEPSGLRTTQFILMSMVAGKGPSGISELAEAVGLDRTTLTRNLRPLTEKGWLEFAGTSDRRRRPVAITDAGRGKLEEALPLWQAAQERLVDGIGSARWVSMLGDLQQITELADSSSA